MQTGIIWHSSWPRLVVDQTANVSHYSNHFSLFYSEYYTAWSLITKIKCLHWPELPCTTCYLLVCVHYTHRLIILDLTLRSRLVNKGVGSNCIETGGLLAKGTRGTTAQENVLESMIHIFIDFTTSSSVLRLPMRLSELRLESQLNNMKTFQTEPVPEGPPENSWLKE